MHLYRIRNPRIIYNGTNVAVTYAEDGKVETRWGTAWRDEGGYPKWAETTVRVEWAEDGYAPYREVEDFTAEAESWIEIDLYDPVTALQILLRYREVFPDKQLQFAEHSVLFGLCATAQVALDLRAIRLLELLTELDAVPETKEVGDADPS